MLKSEFRNNTFSNQVFLFKFYNYLKINNLHEFFIVHLTAKAVIRGAFVFLISMKIKDLY